MQAREIMTEDPVCCLASDSIQAASILMRDNACGMLPVVDNMQNKRAIGVITDRDIVCRIIANENMDCNNAAVQQAMTTGKLWTVRPNDSIDDVIDCMEEGQVRRVLVADEGMKVLGVIATADIALEIDEPDEIAEVFEEISEPTHIPHA